jgi:hypothetical protein
MDFIKIIDSFELPIKVKDVDVNETINLELAFYLCFTCKEEHVRFFKEHIETFTSHYSVVNSNERLCSMTLNIEKNKTGLLQSFIESLKPLTNVKREIEFDTEVNKLINGED